MSVTKIGLNQVNKPAPLGFRRFTNAVILCFIPMVTGIVQGVTMSDEKRNLWMIGVASVPFCLKGIGMILGNGQEYTPSNEQIDEQNSKEIKIENDGN